MRSVMSLFRFGIDLDGVLNDLGETMLSHWKSEGVVDLGFSFDQVHEYEFERCIPGVTRRKVGDMLLDGEVFRAANPIGEAILTLDRLREAGAELHVVTARGLSGAHRRWTQEWLQRWHVPYDRLAIVGKAKKLEYAEEHGLDFFVEDHWPTAYAMADVCRMSLLIDRPYNQAPIPPGVNMLRAFTWREIRHFFLGGLV